jgi:hypothetical protein
LLVLVILAGHTWWGSGYPWVLLIIAGVVALVATQLPQRDRGTPPAEGAAPPPGAVPGDGVGDTGTGTGSGSESEPRTYSTPPVYVEQPRPVHPRKKGPILFWFALAVMAVALGVLGVVDLAGASVAPSAYPALVLALSGVFLLVGAFWGRAGGLILIGLVAAMVTAGATIVDQWDPHKQVERPLVAADVQGSYHLDAGNLVVDLTQVSDPQALDGRTVHVSADVGHLDISVPTGVTVVTHASISGPGGLNVFGQDSGGVDTTVDTVHRAGPKAPTLTIDADLHIGAIDVSTGSN